MINASFQSNIKLYVFKIHLKIDGPKCHNELWAYFINIVELKCCTAYILLELVFNLKI